MVVTNYHVVEGAERVEVTLHDGRKFSSADIRRDPKSDVAIVKLDVKEALPFLEFGDSDAMEVGDRVLALGGNDPDAAIASRLRQGPLQWRRYLVHREQA